jgi:hypothetical protein
MPLSAMAADANTLAQVKILNLPEGGWMRREGAGGSACLGPCGALWLARQAIKSMHVVVVRSYVDKVLGDGRGAVELLAG